MKLTVVLSYVFSSKWLIVVLVIAVLSVLSETGLRKGYAQNSEPFTVTSAGAHSQFPDGLTFTIEIQSEIRIDDVRVLSLIHI